MLGDERKKKRLHLVVLGHVDAGKSTLFALLTRLFVSGEGKITVAGHDLARSPRAALSPRAASA